MFLSFVFCYNEENGKGDNMQVDKIIPIELTKEQAVSYSALVAKERCDNEIRRVKYMGGGSYGKAVKVEYADGGAIVVKFMRVDGMLEKETGDLTLLRENCSVKMPAVLFKRYKDERVPVDCYAMEYIEGKPMIYDFSLYFASKKKRLAIAEKIAEGLHSLHECKNAKFGDALNPDCDSWLEYYKPFAKSVLDKAQELAKKGKLKKDIVETMQKAWDKFGIIFEEEVKDACLIHGDLNVVNIMVDKSHNLKGFIDPLNSCYADREYDLFQFYNLTGKRFSLGEVYAEKYGASKRFYDKLAFYGLFNEVYCFIKSGVLVGFIMRPLVKNMNKRLKDL